MNKLPMIARYFMAVLLVVFGLNKFLQFLPPPMPEGAAAAFMGGLGASVYMFPLLAIVEIIVGVMLLLNKKVALALLLFAPIALNILLYHVFLDLAGGAIGYIVFIITVYLLFQNKSKYDPILSE